jgi:hypothetical protein
MTYSPETPAHLSSLNDQRFYFSHLPSKKGKGYCRGQAAALKGKCMYRNQINTSNMPEEGASC